MKNKKIISALKSSVEVSRTLIDSDDNDVSSISKILIHNQIFIMEGLTTLLEAK